ncbi:MAG: NrfD/PsrC family molybdoenzyme membrane anchor subunit, partial [Ktedonobacterales bacterium]
MTMERGLQGRRQAQSGGQGQRERRLDSERRSERGVEGTSYYNRPMIKKPTWKWFIPLYFFIGGLGGGVALIGG